MEETLVKVNAAWYQAYESFFRLYGAMAALAIYSGIVHPTKRSATAKLTNKK